MAFLATFLIRRLAQGLLIVLIVSFAIFTALRLVPGDPARLILGPMASDAVVEQTAREMGLRDPIPVQYVHWLGQVLHGNLGTSFIKAKSGGEAAGGRDVSALGDKATVVELLEQSVPMTLQLAALALVFAFMISLPIGILAGMNSGGWFDRFAVYLGSAFVSIPNFWLAIVLALVVTAELQWIPSIGYEGFAYTILPAFVIAIEMSPIFMRSLASSIASAKQRNFVQLADVRGLSKRRVFLRHILRNAAVPVLNVFGVQIGAMLGGVLIVEYIFNYPGVGLLTVQAVLERDFPVIQGVALISACLFVVINILVDLISTKIDPRLDF
ncbi:ABC transporter permease [Acidisoma cellulosilytica]|uniref:ABC transporter permease n=1 Tax=Acidisoma cellulosilyticum TaxID=2802395 RepID=A0A963Z4U0_9PROT|nr:ABC transporter permease [Acidisoma cellulosilyticum]MCB8882020.1 ABC transporter permease [Acidisoma cellulosilyticum]